VANKTSAESILSLPTVGGVSHGIGQTSRGVPRFRDTNPAARYADTFILSGSEDLVPTGIATDESFI
jgi:hypothetical protein